MSASIKELEKAVSDLEKNAHAIRALLDSLPLLRKVVAAAQMFGESISVVTIKGENGVVNPNKNHEDKSGDVGSHTFTNIILETMKEVGGRIKPAKMFDILNKKGRVTDDRAGRLKVSFTMRYLMKRRLLDGTGVKGYILKKEKEGNSD